MGLREWWRESRDRKAAMRQSLAWNGDQALIAEQAPELVGKSDVEGMAYVLEKIQEWNEICTPEEAATFASRLKASQDSFTAEGLTMPYWGNLVVLRRYQAEIGRAELGLDALNQAS